MNWRVLQENHLVCDQQLMIFRYSLRTFTSKILKVAATLEKTPVERRASMTWAQRLKRLFGIDIETCPAGGGALRIIACIEDPVVIKRILTHLDTKKASTVASARHPAGRHRRWTCSTEPPDTHMRLRSGWMRQGNARSDVKK